jgi:hypothetical protein
MEVVEIDIGNQDINVYMRDEWDPIVKQEGIFVPSIDSCISTLQTSLANGCRMFLNSFAMYDMLYFNPQRFTNIMNGYRNYLIIAIPGIDGTEFKDVVTLGSEEGRITNGYTLRSQMAYTEYVPLVRILPGNMLYIDTIEFIKSYCELKPFIIEKNGIAYIFKHPAFPIYVNDRTITPKSFYDGHQDLIRNMVNNPLIQINGQISNIGNFSRTINNVINLVSICEYLTQILAVYMYKTIGTVIHVPRSYMIKRQINMIDDLINNERYVNTNQQNLTKGLLLRNVIVILSKIVLEFDDDFLVWLNNKYLNGDYNIFVLDWYNLPYLFDVLRNLSFQRDILFKPKFLYGKMYNESDIDTQDDIFAPQNEQLIQTFERLVSSVDVSWLNRDLNIYQQLILPPYEKEGGIIY